MKPITYEEAVEHLRQHRVTFNSAHPTNRQRLSLAIRIVTRWAELHGVTDEERIWQEIRDTFLPDPGRTISAGQPTIIG